MAFKKERNVTETSIMELVVMYSEENELSIEDVGDELRKDKTFVKMFQQDLVHNHEAVFKGQPTSKSFDGWI